MPRGGPARPGEALGRSGVEAAGAGESLGPISRRWVFHVSPIRDARNAMRPPSFSWYLPTFGSARVHSRAARTAPFVVQSNSSSGISARLPASWSSRANGSAGTFRTPMAAAIDATVSCERSSPLIQRRPHDTNSGRGHSSIACAMAALMRFMVSHVGWSRFMPCYQRLRPSPTTSQPRGAFPRLPPSLRGWARLTLMLRPFRSVPFSP